MNQPKKIHLKHPFLNYSLCTRFLGKTIKTTNSYEKATCSLCIATYRPKQFTNNKKSGKLLPEIRKEILFYLQKRKAIKNNESVYRYMRRVGYQYLDRQEIGAFMKELEQQNIIQISQGITLINQNNFVMVKRK